MHGPIKVKNPEIVFESFCKMLHTNLSPKTALYFRLPDYLWAQ